MAVIEFKSLGKHFGHQEVLHDINLTIEEGEFLVLVGPSGCGKSTLLRILAGLESASHGKVLINGQDMTDALPADRRLAMVFQSYALYPHMTVRENLSFGMRMRGTPRAVIESKLAKAISILKLHELMDRRPAELSGGQCQRVAIGRAIVQEPDAFLLDEPLSNLDAELRLHLRLELVELHRQLRTTMVCVTHDQVEAMTLADRIVVLHQGRIEQIGTPREIHRHPRNRFVAEFIGSPPMNILPIAAVPLDLATAVPPNATHWGIRPEHLIPSDEGTWSMQVLHAEWVGSSYWVHGTLAGSPHRLCFDFRGSQPPSRGQIVRLQPLEEHCHLFDTDGGRIAS